MSVLTISYTRLMIFWYAMIEPLSDNMTGFEMPISTWFFNTFHGLILSTINWDKLRRPFNKLRLIWVAMEEDHNLSKADRFEARQQGILIIHFWSTHCSYCAIRDGLEIIPREGVILDAPFSSGVQIVQQNLPVGCGRKGCFCHSAKFKLNFSQRVHNMHN